MVAVRRGVPRASERMGKRSSVNRAKGSGAEAKAHKEVQAVIEGALIASAKNPFGAAKNLEAVLQGLGKYAEELLNNATLAAAKKVVECGQIAFARTALAKALESGGKEDSKDKIGSLDNLVSAAKFDDAKLQYRVSHVLGLRGVEYCG